VIKERLVFADRPGESLYVKSPGTFPGEDVVPGVDPGFFYGFHRVVFSENIAIFGRIPVCGSVVVVQGVPSAAGPAEQGRRQAAGGRRQGSKWQGSKWQVSSGKVAGSKWQVPSAKY